MKTAKRILTVALALMLIFALAAPSFAMSTSASYVQNALSNAPTETGVFNVNLSILSYSMGNSRIERYNLPVNVGTAGITDTYFVSDVLDAAQTQYSWLTFYSDIYTVLTGDSSYVYGVKDTSVSTTVFGRVPGYSGTHGWMFRINNRFPLLHQSDRPAGYNTSTMGPLGATIDEAYVTANQTVTLYYATTQSDSGCTRYMAADSAVFDSEDNTLSFDLYCSKSYYSTTPPYYYWYIKAFTIVPDNMSFDIYVNGTLYTESSEDGTIVIEDENLPIVTGSNSISVVPHETSYTYNGVTYGLPTYTGCYYKWTE